MGIQISPDSELGKELRRWEQHHTQYTAGEGPGNPYAYRPFPKMVYKARKRDDGRIICLENPPQPHEFMKPEDYTRALARVEFLNEQACRTVGNTQELERAAREGFREGGPQAAMDYLESLEREIADAAAEANFAAQRMTPKAQAERKKREDATVAHVPE